MSNTHSSQVAAAGDKPRVLQPIEEMMAEGRVQHTMEDRTRMPALDAVVPTSLREAHEELEESC